MVLNSETQTIIKRTLLECCVKDESEKIRGQIIDCIIELGLSLSKGSKSDAWLELVPFAMQLCTDGTTVPDRVNGLQLLGYLCESAFHMCVDTLQDILNVYKQCLTDRNPKIKIGALEAISFTIRSMESDKCRIFAPMMKSSLNLLREVLKHETIEMGKKRREKETGRTDKKTSRDDTTDPDTFNDDEDDEEFPMSTSLISILSEIAKAEPLLFKDVLSEYSKAMAAIATSNKLPKSLRGLSLNLLSDLANASPSLCRKSEDFVTACVEITCGSLLLQVCSDEEWNEREYGPEGADDMNDLPSIAEYALDSLCDSLDSRVLVPLLLKRTNDYWTSMDFTYRLAALCSVTQVSEYLMDEELISSLLGRCITFISDANYRVRYAAISSVGQIVVDHPGVYDESYRIKTIRKILEVFDQAFRGTPDMDSSASSSSGMDRRSEMSLMILKNENWKVLAHCAACISNIVSNPYVDQTYDMENEDYEIGHLGGGDSVSTAAGSDTTAAPAGAPDEGNDESKDPTQYDAQYLDREGLLTPLLKRLFDLLSTVQNHTIQEQCLTAVATLAGSSQRLFVRYFEKFGPILIDIIQKATKPEEIQIRGRALECMAQMGAAVGNELFAPIARKMIPFTIQYFENSDSISGDEYLHRKIMQTWPLVASSIGSDFVPYMKGVSPIIIRTMRMDVEAVPVVSSTDVSDAAMAKLSEDGFDWQQELDLRMYGDTYVSEVYKDGIRHVVNVSKVENKLAAIDVCESIVETLKFQIGWPTLDEYFNLMVDLCSFEFSDRVRQHSIVSLPTMAQCAVDMLHSSQSGIVGEDSGVKVTQDMAGSVIRKTLATLISVLKSDRTAAVLSDTVQTLADFLKSGPRDAIKACMNESDVRDMVDSVVKCISLSQRRIRLLYQSQKQSGVEFDRIDKENLQWHEASENDLMVNLSVIIAELIKINGNDMCGIIQDKYHLLLEFLQSAAKADPSSSLSDSSSGGDSTAKKTSSSQTPSSIVTKTALYVFCDVFEQLKPEFTAQFISILVPLMLEIIRRDSDHAVRQVVFYLFGVMAERNPRVFASTEGCLASVVSASTLILESNRDAYCSRKVTVPVAAALDNVVAAMVKIEKYCRVSENPEKHNLLLSTVVSVLPLKLDQTEGEFVHSRFLEWVESKHPSVVGSDTKMFGVLSIMAQIIQYQMGRDELIDRIKRIVQTMPRDQLLKLSDEMRSLLGIER